MFLKIEQAQLFYEVYGSGMPILFFHGNGEDHHYFAKQIPYFIEHGYQVIVMDTRGHGQSSYHGEPLNFVRFAQDGIALLDHLKITQAHIVGFSDGANTAMQLAVSAPERCYSLVLNGGNLFPNGMKRWVVASVYLSYWKAKLTRRQHQAAIINLMVHHPRLSVRDIANFQMPVCVIAGEHDMIKRSHSETIAKAIPHAQLHILAGGDHFVAKKQSDRFNSVVLHFFQEVDANGR